MVVTPASRKDHLYSVKIISCKKKSDYVIQKLRSSTIFESKEELKRELSEVQDIPSVIEQLGYIEPGHGAKGRQRWLSSPEDFRDMYTLHRNKAEILFWCVGQNPSISGSNKRVHSPDRGQESSKKRSRYENHTDKMVEVESIEDELMKSHDKTYSREQIRAWAHLIQMGKHESYTTPPSKPFWKTPSGSKGKNELSSVTISPSKSVQLKGQLVDQLLKWHELLEKGGISQSQYEELQGSIMKDVKKF